TGRPPSGCRGICARWPGSSNSALPRWAISSIAAARRLKPCWAISCNFWADQPGRGMMQLGALLPLGDIGGEPAVLCEYAQTAEGIGYDFIEAPDHVLGANPAKSPAPDRTGAGLYHDPFVLFGYLAGCTSKLGFSTGVLILPQRQTALVAKQAACLDALCGGRFRLGIGVGWNEVEFVGLNENFHNRGRRSEEQVEVMQALWAEPHVAFK